MLLVAGVVHQRVDAAELRDVALDELVRDGGLGEVRRVGQDAALASSRRSRAATSSSCPPEREHEDDVRARLGGHHARFPGRCPAPRLSR